MTLEGYFGASDAIELFYRQHFQSPAQKKIWRSKATCSNLPAAVSTELSRNRGSRRRVGIRVVLEHLVRVADGDFCLLKHVDDTAEAAT
jgi:hypothetical protein